MIKIIEIIKNKKTVILKLNNNQILSIYEEVYLKLNLKINEVINIDNILEINLYYECLNYAQNIIKKRDISYNKLEEKLRYKFKKTTVIQVLNHLIDHNYIDEQTSINNYIDKMINNNDGPIKIRAKLLKKGYNIDNLNFNKYHYNLEKCAINYQKTNKEEDKLKKQQKLCRYLLNKGYNISDINSYMFGRRKDND